MTEGHVPGILAIWNDVATGREADFDTWFQGEHLVERLGVPGFRFGRRHEAVSGAPRFFVFYVTDGPEVLTSKAYLERLDNPTPMTRMIMSEVFRNMNRTSCRRVARRGDFRGSYAVTREGPRGRVRRGVDRRRCRPGVDGREAARRRQEDQGLPDRRYAAAAAG